MVCLMTVSLAPWRRPWRPLIPFASSICSSSESKRCRYLSEWQNNDTMTNTTMLKVFIVHLRDVRVPLPLDDVTAIFFCVRRLVGLQLPLEPEQFGSCRVAWPQANKHVLCEAGSNLGPYFTRRLWDESNLLMLLSRVAFSFFCLRVKTNSQLQDCPCCVSDS